MNTKIKLYLSYLIYNKPIIYISIFLLIGYMITTVVNNKIEQYRKEEQIRKDNISKLDKRKQKFIDSEVLRLKPIEDKERKLKHELDTLKREITKTKECINGVKETLGTGNWYECNKEDNSIIQKASASEEVLSVNDRDKILMDRVCDKSPKSPICNNWDLYNRLKKITNDIGIKDMGVPLGIKFAESGLGTNFAKYDFTTKKIVNDNGGECSKYNNWGGIKQKVNSDGKVITNYIYPDNNGCYLARFDTIEEYWINYITIIKKNYIDRGCKFPNMVKCIAYNYVGNPKVAEQGWINNVVAIAE